METCLSETDETALRGRESCVQFLVDQYPSLLTPDLTMMQLRMMGLPFFRSSNLRKHSIVRNSSIAGNRTTYNFLQYLGLLMSLVIATANCNTPAGAEGKYVKYLVETAVLRL